MLATRAPEKGRDGFAGIFAASRTDTSAMIGIGVIGYGFWGPHLVRNFSEASGSRVVAVSDLSRARLDRVSGRYPNVLTTTDAPELIGHPDVDAVVIATPVSTHCDLGMRALTANKHVWVEKPLAATSDEARRLRDVAARDADVIRRTLPT